MFRPIALICIALVSIPLSADVKKLNVGVSKEGKFEVFYSRAKSNTTGAALAGLIGAAIQSSAESSNDNAKTQALLAKIQDSSCSSRLLETLQEKLAEKDYQVDLTDEKSPPNLDINIEYCGFKMVNTQTYLMSPFIRLEIKYSGEDKADKFDELILITGKKELSYGVLSDADSEIEADFADVLHKAGKRIANKIIYNTGRNL